MYNAAMNGFFRTFWALLRVSFWNTGGGRLLRLDLERMDDHKLMLRYARKNDVDAFEVLLKRYRTQVFGYLVNACRSKERAEELYQETFLRVIKASSRYDKKASFRTWIFSIARNLIIDDHRKFKNRPGNISLSPEDADSSADHTETLKSSDADPERLYHAQEIRSVLKKALALLSDPQREMFELREHAGLSFQQAADVAGCTVNTAKSRMRYALLKIRETFEENGIFPQETGQ